jgi:large subunit ribosomal protein L10
VNRIQKEEAIAAMHDTFAVVQGAVLANYQGLSVRQITEIRTAFREAGISMKVVKNRLAKIAIKDTPLEVLAKDFVGPIAIAYSLEDPTATAKVASKCAKEQELFEIKCGYVDNSRLDLTGVNTLAKLPSRDELRSQLLGTLNAPASKFLGTLKAVPQQIVLLLSAQKDKLSESAGE